jgi:DNA-binding LacI/PurR family transcriptional regulator
MKEAGLEIEDTLLFRGDNRFASGREGANWLIETGRPFTAVFAGNDVMAIGAIREFQHRGLCVPNDVSVVGFDGIALGQFMTPALTTIVQPRYDAGRRAFALLIQRIQREYEGESRHELLEIDLEIRESTAPLVPLGEAEVNSR